MRALAVGLVLAYHLFPLALPGGFLGVDIFFAISGFLITSLLLRESALSGTIRLGDFWRRRARRLLPALGLVLLVCAALALPLGGDLLVGIGSQIAGASFFVSNWVFIANGADYFARDTPELFRNTWSLSIEEQFYILLPLLVLLLLKLRGRSSRAIPLIILGVVSAALMAELSLQGADPTRVYFGSDTHTFGLFWGAALAALIQPQATAPPDRAAGPARQTGWGIVTVVSLAVLAWLAATLPEGSPQSFQGGFQLATVAALALVWSVTRPGAVVGRALDVQPLRWIGERSYGIYLWHWPLLLIATAAFGPAQSWLVAVVTLVTTLGAAALSYRYVEQPVRRFGLRRSIRLLVRPLNYTPRQRTVAIALGVVLAVAIPAGVTAVVTAPAQTSAAEAIARGQAALERSEPTATSPETQPPDAPDTQDRSSPDPRNETKDGSTPSPGATPTATPDAPLVPEGAEISAVGDSVMLASLPELEDAFPGIAIDAAVSRGMGVGVELTAEWASDGSLRQVLLVGLGTNGPVEPESLDELLTIAADRPLILVNAHADRDWIPQVNTTLTEFAAAHRGVVVADWTGAVTGVEDALAGDDIHPNPSGGVIYAQSVQRALEALQQPGEARGFALPRR
ncbi:acyltransferase 3 [Leucobacter sp. 7(1)]|nr:acyltransferase 3 [Leucobacter sp. 7(1)]